MVGEMGQPLPKRCIYRARTHHRQQLSTELCTGSFHRFLHGKLSKHSKLSTELSTELCTGPAHNVIHTHNQSYPQVISTELCTGKPGKTAVCTKLSIGYP